MFWSVLYILATSESLSSHGARMWSMRSVFVSFVFLRILSLYARCFILLANPLCMRSQCLIVISHHKTNVGKMLNGECDRCVISRDTAITYLINGNDRLKIKEEKKKRTEHESLQIIICIIRNGNCWQNSTSSNRNMASTAITWILWVNCWWCRSGGNQNRHHTINPVDSLYAS